MGDDGGGNMQYIQINFYPRPPYGGRPSDWTVWGWSYLISIHVPRMGDDNQKPDKSQKENISIHVPRMGDDY